MLLNKSLKTSLGFCNNCRKVVSSVLVVVQQQRRCNSTEPPKNIFEVYQKNSHWLGVYKRHEVVKEKIKSLELEQKIVNEKHRLAPIDLHKYIENNRTEWTPDSRRVGAVGIKLGTTVLWTKEGFRHACTLIQVNIL